MNRIPTNNAKLFSLCKMTKKIKAVFDFLTLTYFTYYSDKCDKTFHTYQSLTFKVYN